jgi:hypothetical protein
MRIHPALLASPLLCWWLCFANAPQQKPAPDDDNGGIVSGKDHAFIIIAPAGWVLDNTSAVPEGLHAVFYPKGGSWKRSPVVMYANTVHKGVTTTRPLRAIIADDISAFNKKSITPTITDEPALITKTERKAVVKRFVDPPRKVCELVAYIDEPKVVVMLVLSADSTDSVTAALPAFKDLVRSYLFITSDVRGK